MGKRKEKKVTQVLLRIPQEIADQYKELAETSGISATEIYNYVIREHFNDAKEFAELAGKVKSGEIDLREAISSDRYDREARPDVLHER